MKWELKDKDDYRIYCRLGGRRFLFANECLFPGRGYSAAMYLIDLDTIHSDERFNNGSIMQLVSEEETDVDKASLIADELEKCDFQTECFADEDSMWKYVRENVIRVMGV